MEYDLVVCVDAYAAVHFMMPLVFQNVQEWKEAAMTRNDVPEEIFGELTVERLRYDQRFIDHIRNQGFGYSSELYINFMIDNWQYGSSFNICILHPHLVSFQMRRFTNKFQPSSFCQKASFDIIIPHFLFSDSWSLGCVFCAKKLSQFIGMLLRI